MRPGLLLVLAASLLGGCSLFGDDPGYTGPADYAFTLNVGCFCAYTGPLRITVYEDEVVDVRLLNPPEQRDESFERIIEERSLTLSDLVEIAHRAEQEADDVEVTYDPTYGFPTSIAIDWYREMADDEISYSVSDYEAL